MYNLLYLRLPEEKARKHWIQSNSRIIYHLEGEGGGGEALLKEIRWIDSQLLVFLPRDRDRGKDRDSRRRREGT
jgi:hypothetical protein